MSDVRWVDIIKLCQTQYKRISRGNLWYDLQLRTLNTETAHNELLRKAIQYRRGEIKQPDFLIQLYKYFAVVRDETETARIEWLGQHVQVHQPDPFTIDCVKIATRELDYINERWRNWAYMDGESVYVVELDNNVEEFFADLPVGPRIISDPMYKMTIGKHAGFAIGAIISFAPQYLLWAHHNIEKFKLSKQLLEDVRREIENKGSD